MSTVSATDKVDEAIEDFLFHLKNGFIITKLPKNTFRSPQRRVLYCDPSGHMINWRSARASDYSSKAEYLADCGHTAYSDSKKKVSIPLSSLVSCQYSKDKFESEEFFMRLVFEGHRNLDIKLTNKQDFEYCMDGFEVIAKNRERFKKTPSFRPETMEEVWDADDYHPLVWEYKPGKTCNIGCGNDLEDILLISSCYGCLWSFLVAFYALLMKGILDSDEKSTLLMMYLVFGVIYVCMVGLAVYTGQMEEDAKRKKKAELGLDEDDELPFDDDDE
mmetsp:Transcript_5225/g.11058  ORF Transcript_5225/g.11058 Transcript_5225/m.11058 type:complete len:275 (+) Transcript_5225:60-884(+)